MEKALTWYHDEGRLRLYDTRPELQAGLVDEWWASNPGGVMVVDSSNAERDQLNRMAQARRLAAGELGPDALGLDNGREIRAGDRVLFSGIYKPAGELWARRPPRRVENGTAAIVVSVDLLAGAAVVRLHEPKTRRRSGAVRELVVPSAAPLELAYARHVYKAQGMTAEVADVATGPRTGHNELYTMITRSRAGTRLHALRVELEAMGADPASLGSPSATPLRREHRAAPEAEDRADHLYPSERRTPEREREVEYATIRQIAKNAGRSSTKQAIGNPSWHAPAQRRVSIEQSASDRATRRQGRNADLQRDLGQSVRRADIQPVSAPGPSPARRPTVRPPQTTPMAQALPARTAIESMGRAYAEGRDIARMLAYYEVAGRLHVTTDPAEEAARRWLADRDAVIVVLNQEQEQRVRTAAAGLQKYADDQLARLEAPVTPHIVLAPDGYRERQARRDDWLRDKSAAALHRPEPGVTNSAYVVAADLERDDDLVRGLSVAAESHLLIPPVSANMQAQVQTNANQIRASMAAKVQAEGHRQAASVAEGTVGGRRVTEPHQAHERARQADRA